MAVADHREIVLKAESVRVQFGPLRAVDDVSLELRSGDLLGLIGPNGAGKTTLLRALSGLQTLTRGIVTILSERLRPDNPDVLRRIGFTADTPSVYEEMTVRTFLRFIARGYDIDGPDADERCDYWLERVWLKEKANARIKQLSRGMRQRIGIARTLLPNPALVILDEPAAGLDPGGRVQFRNLLGELRAQGKCLIVSSHILADMNEYCTHVAIMHAGKIVKMGTVGQIAHEVSADRCRYTMSFSRHVPMINDRLVSIPEIANLQVNHDGVTFEYPADPGKAAELLRELIRMELPIASFAPMRSGLEEAYLRQGLGEVD